MRAVVMLSMLCGGLTALALAVGGTAAPGPCQAGDTLVSISGYRFVPDAVTVPPNTTVCWTNEDSVTHTVTSNAASVFDSGDLAQGQSFRHTFASEGAFDYDCSVFGHDMPGTVTVSAAPPPPPPGPPPPAPPPPSPPPPAPPASPPPPQVQPLEVRGLRFTVQRAGQRRVLVARGKTNKPAAARLALLRKHRVRASARKRWTAGTNTIRLRVPATLAHGRWTAELRVGTLRFRRSIRFG